MKLTLNTQSVERAIATLREKAPAALVRALNRGVGGGRTVLVRDVSKDLRLKVGQVRDRTSVANATAASMVARIVASAQKVPAIEFGARGPEPSRGKGRGVSTKLPAGRFPHAFIATVRSPRGGLHRGVFERKATKRLPIREIKGPSVWFVAGKHLEPAAARAIELAAKTLEHEMSRILPTK